MVSDVLPGEYISFKVKDVEHSGLVLPQTTKETLFIKLSNGYNIGIKFLEVKEIKKQKIEQEKSAPKKIKSDSKLPNITIITTGGTITSRVDYKTGAVHPLTKPEELIAQIPELEKLANIKIISPFSVFSEDIESIAWQELAELTHKELENKTIKGVIVTHGTDTLHYTSAALSFMLGKITKPVALVGGQRSSDRGSFDGAQNLICAVHYCLSDINRVAIVMHGETDDNYCLAIPGTRARKMHTSRRDAFRPINSSPLARIWPDGRFEKVQDIEGSSQKYSNKFEKNIALVKFFPGLNEKVFEAILTKHKGVIIEGTGMGHLAVEPLDKKASLLSVLKKAIKKGVIVGMTSQCLYGRVDPLVYSRGRQLQEAGVIYLEDMLPETAYVKLGIVLAKAKKKKEVEELMLENWAGEVGASLAEKDFLY